MNPMQHQRMVPTTEERTIPRSTVPGLLEAFGDAFRSPFKVEKLVYERGKGAFTVERLVPEADVEGSREDVDAAFLTPFQMIRQHAELEIQEPVEDPLEALSRAIQSLTTRGIKLTMFVCDTRSAVRAWLGRDLRVEDIWQVPIHEDPDVHDAGVFVVGSRSGPHLKDIEAAILCRFKDGAS